MLAFNVVFTLVPTLMKYVYDDYDKYVTWLIFFLAS